MSEQPDLSSLPQRMRYAADVLDEMCESHPTLSGITHAALLRETADEWEAEDRAAAERDAHLVELLDAFLAHYHSDSVTEKLRIHSICRKLIDSGWRRDIG